MKCKNCEVDVMCVEDVWYHITGHTYCQNAMWKCGRKFISNEIAEPLTVDIEKLLTEYYEGKN